MLYKRSKQHPGLEMIQSVKLVMFRLDLLSNQVKALKVDRIFLAEIDFRSWKRNTKTQKEVLNQK